MMALKLNPQQRIVAWRLSTGRIVTTDELAGALWGWDDDRDLPLGAGVQTLVYQLRRLTGAPIVLVGYGMGYQVPSPHLERFRDLLADEIDRNAHYDDAVRGRPTSAFRALREAAHG